MLRKLPGGKHQPIDGIQRMEAARREGYAGVGATVFECTDEQAEELRRKCNPYDCQLN
jgi:ParB-like chromosome segregation protein Spo0J